MKNLVTLTGLVLTGLALNGVLPNSELWLNYIVGIKSIALIFLIFLMILTTLIKKGKERIPINWFNIIINISLIINATIFGYVGYAVISICILMCVLTYNNIKIEEIKNEM